ncbi:MAG: site-specific DNA-methyltransferase [Gemmatimonadetes bacterium]|nr:site-specific DNA-methyltransferase [Gemmatimonadota bacterium]
MPTLDFKGKQHIYAHHLTVPYRPLMSDAGRSMNAADSDDNLIIHDDNLYALKALLPRYAGRVKCIYIDPPYNTGKGDWVYNDNVNSPLMQEWLKQNSPVDGEDLERHDKWLCMMWPRLHLLGELLADDGVIFISIDDNEQHHLRMLMDEIFGKKNFVANIIWQKKYAPANDAKYFSDNHDFVLCYAKNRTDGKGNSSVAWQRRLLQRTEKQDKLYKYDDNDGRGPWRTDNLSVKTYSPEYDYPIVNPNTDVAYNPPDGRCWLTNREQMQTWIDENRVFFGRDGKNSPQLKRYLREVQQGIVPLTIWLYDEVGHTDGARKALKEIFSDQQLLFDNPKALGLLQRICTIAGGKNALILDSFAGSGTTAHAVLALNKEDGGNRKFILVECEDYADTTTAERVRRVINGVPNAKDDALREGLGGSFTYCTLGPPIELEGMLTGDALPDYAAMAAYLLYTASGISAGAAALEPLNNDGLFHSNHTTDYYLLYEPNLDYLRSDAAILNEERARCISTASQQNGRKALVFGPGKYIGQAELTRMDITFCQLPYELHRAL